MVANGVKGCKYHCKKATCKNFRYKQSTSNCALYGGQLTGNEYTINIPGSEQWYKKPNVG